MSEAKPIADEVLDSIRIHVAGRDGEPPVIAMLTCETVRSLLSTLDAVTCDRDEAEALLGNLRTFVQSIYDLRLFCRSCESGDGLKCRCGEDLSSLPLNVCDYYAIEDLRNDIDALLSKRGKGAK